MSRALRIQALTFEVEILSIKSGMEKFPLKKSEAEWKQELTAREYEASLTERPHSRSHRVALFFRLSE
jgi:hypothetical protein